MANRTTIEVDDYLRELLAEMDAAWARVTAAELGSPESTAAHAALETAQRRVANYTRSLVRMADRRAA